MILHGIFSFQFQFQFQVVKLKHKGAINLVLLHIVKFTFFNVEAFETTTTSVPKLISSETLQSARLPTVQKRFVLSRYTRINYFYYYYYK